MYLSDLINHTKSVLPLFTDKFTTNIDITAISKSGDDVSVAAVSHGLSVSDLILISGVETLVVISDITTVAGIATATCSSPHDLTLGFTKSANITSAESAYDGVKTILAVPSITTFTFAVTGTPASSTGTLKTFHNIGFNGIQTVTVIVDANNFEYSLANDNLIAGTGSNMLLNKSPRISGAATVERAVESYTRENTDELWGFFVISDTSTSDDRSGESDAKNERIGLNDGKLKFIQNMSFVVFEPSHASISGRLQFDNAQALLKPIYKTLAGFLPENTFTSEQETILMPAGHSVEEYEGAYLLYNYEFQVTQYMDSVGCSSDQTEFMANTGDYLPDINTINFNIMQWDIENVFDKVVKNDVYDIKDA